MTNILVIDPLLECGVLVKGVLMGQHYGISLSSDYDEARQKLNTGLFDIICINAGETAFIKFLNEAKDNLPDLPVIVLAERPLAENSLEKIFRAIPKPLSITRLTTTVKEAVEHLKGIQQKAQHRSLTLPTEITNHKANLRCLMTDLGLKGALIQSDLTSDPEAKLFSSFFLRHSEKIVTSILVKNSRPIRLDSQVAFTENKPDGSLKQTGLRFPSLGSQERKMVEDLINQAA